LAPSIARPPDVRHSFPRVQLCKTNRYMRITGSVRAWSAQVVRIRLSITACQRHCSAVWAEERRHLCQGRSGSHARDLSA
jgi:hypothetical protein